MGWSYGGTFKKNIVEVNKSIKTRIKNHFRIIFKLKVLYYKTKNNYIYVYRNDVLLKYHGISGPNHHRIVKSDHFNIEISKN